MMDVIVLGAGFSGSLAATRFIDRQALHNVIVSIDADFRPIGILALNRTTTLAGHIAR
jgi:2-polyprenyl-6-methoxyphenol hydroxylase-like FAD-dependent oxidoreductase